MLSRDERKALAVERKAERSRKDAESKARYVARAAEIDASYVARMAAIKAKSEARRAVPVSAAPVGEPGTIEGAPGVYRPSMGGGLAAQLVPGVGVFQAIKAIKSQRVFLDSLSPEQRAEYLRRTPGLSGS